jgi:hypothetical protein
MAHALCLQIVVFDTNNGFTIWRNVSDPINLRFAHASAKDQTGYAFDAGAT